jgi:hypothetical protein
MKLHLHPQSCFAQFRPALHKMPNRPHAATPTLR